MLTVGQESEMEIPDETKKRVSYELGFDIKVLKTSRKTESESEENRVSRLETVIAFIQEFGKVGSVDQPDDYVYDTQPMWFGPSGQHPVVYFTGMTKQTTFALVGSLRHLIGEDPKRPEWPSFSQLSRILVWINHGQGSTESIVRAVRDLAEVGAENKMPKQQLEFFAKRLFVAPYSDDKGAAAVALIATPLYVAMTD